MAEPSYDVAIVGYGPVGAFTGLLLAEAGLRVAILERSRELFELPRAVGLDGESLPVDDAMAGAPRRTGDFFEVPKIIGGDS